MTPVEANKETPGEVTTSLQPHGVKRPYHQFRIGTMCMHILEWNNGLYLWRHWCLANTNGAIRIEPPLVSFPRTLQGLLPPSTKAGCRGISEIRLGRA